MIVKPLTEHHLEFLSLKGGCRGSSESTLVKMSNCWKSHALAQIQDSCRPEIAQMAKMSFLAIFITIPILWNFETIRGSLMKPK